MLKLPQKIYDNQSPNSLVTALRKKRFAFFKTLIPPAPHQLKILDVGGTVNFWHQSGFLSELSQTRDVTITILNLAEETTNYPNIKTVVGDATNLKQYSDQEFDIVFSNSVIEHLFTYENQQKMASEIKRVGKRYFVQTPNLYFPIEPHFQFPLFQFLPLSIKVFLISNFDLGWRRKAETIQQAIKTVTEIRLLSKPEIMSLFPHAKIFEEKFFGLTKSLIAYDGWEH